MFLPSSCRGDDAKVLRLGVGHIPGTALPGQGGNVGIAGHRDTFFRGLRNIHKGEQILLTTPAEDYLYTVRSTEVVSPEDVGVLKNQGRPTLTLVTCYPFYYVGPAPKRFIVQAVRVESASSERSGQPVPHQHNKHKSEKGD